MDKSYIYGDYKNFNPTSFSELQDGGVLKN